jgi:hypothetical protein
MRTSHSSKRYRAHPGVSVSDRYTEGLLPHAARSRDAGPAMFVKYGVISVDEDLTSNRSARQRHRAKQGTGPTMSGAN